MQFPVQRRFIMVAVKTPTPLEQDTLDVVRRGLRRRNKGSEPVLIITLDKLIY